MLNRPLRRTATARVALCTLTALTVAIGGCGESLGGPPLEIEFRDSLVQLGQIVRLTNSSTKPLRGLKIKITNPNGDVKHHEIETLAPGDTVEVGWKKMDAFQVEPGARVTVRCDGYLLPFMAKLAAGEARSGRLTGRSD